MTATRFGTQRPGSEPPQRQPLTAEEIRYRETFTRAGHLAGQSAPLEATSGGNPSHPNAASSKVFDETAIRAALSQEGLDFSFQIFPIGEKPPAGAAGSNQYRGQRLTELESERSIMRERMLAAEAAAAGAIRELSGATIQLSELQVRFDTLQTELQSLKPEQSKKKKESA